MNTKTTQQNLALLMEMLTYKRPHKSKSEKEFNRKYIDPLGVKIDPAGNRIKVIGNSPILWSSHTDTVHHSAGKQTNYLHEGLIKVENAKPHNRKKKDKHYGGRWQEQERSTNCLGADDGAGVFIMIEMIRRNIPGTYVFHRGEECGGIGSSWIANSKDRAELFTGIKCAIALDRRGNSDIITHQLRRTASDNFAASLAAQMPGYKPCQNGVFTDTKNYINDIGECSNLGVGYRSEHSHKESLDWEHTFALLEYLCSLEQTKLQFERKPGEHCPDTGSWLYGNYSQTGGRGQTTGRGRARYAQDELDWDYAGYMKSAGYERRNGVYRRASRLDSGLSHAEKAYFDEEIESQNHSSDVEYLELIKQFPECAKEVLEDYGISYDDFLETLVNDYRQPSLAARQIGG